MVQDISENFLHHGARKKVGPRGAGRDVPFFKLFFKLTMVQDVCAKFLHHGV
jgi:hypothetical protein